MRNMSEIRFISTNYYTLQGLRTLPLGLCLVFLCLWANNLQVAARGSDFIFPLITLAVSAILLFAIDRYYLQTFGQVQQTVAARQLEWLVAVLFGIPALLGTWLDMSVRLPVSILGLVFAAGLLVDFARITWLVKGHALLYYPLGAVLMAGLSILPLLGLSNWWSEIGLGTQLIGIALGIGIFTILAGIWGHVFLVQHLQLPGREHDNAI
jgi:hypothetical protein